MFEDKPSATDCRACQVISFTYTVTPALTALELKTATGGYDIDVRIVLKTDTTDKHEVWETQMDGQTE